MEGKISANPPRKLHKDRAKKLYSFVERLINVHHFVMENTTNVIFKYFPEIGTYRQVDNDTISSVIGAEFKSRAVTPRIVNECILNMKNILITMPKAFIDEDFNIINAKNGVFDLKKFKLLPHSHEYHSSIQINCDIPEDFQKVKQEYQGKVFDSFMKTFTGNDPYIKEMLLRFFGLAISNIPGYKAKKGLFLVSKKGNTGKSLIKNVISSIVGDQYVANIDLKALEGRWGTGICYKKRIVGSGDQSTTSISEIPVFKQLTGGDRVYAEQKGKNGFSYVFNGVMFFCANKLPNFGGDKGSHVYDRFIIYEPKYSVPYAEQDRNLYEKLIQEKEYIVVLCLEALKRFIEDDYCFPEVAKILESREQYEKDNNSFISFCIECVIPLNLSENDKLRPISCKSLFDIYKTWASYNNFGNTIKRKDAMDILKEKGLHTVRTYDGFNYFTKITISEETIEDYRPDRDIVRRLGTIPKGWGTDKKELDF